MKYKIYYVKDELFSQYSLGARNLMGKNKLPDPENLEKTHVYIKTMDASFAEHVFTKMQGEVWSPNGEARALLKSKGISHTSMSVGDIIVAQSGAILMVDTIGYFVLKDKVPIETGRGYGI